MGKNVFDILKTGLDPFPFKNFTAQDNVIQILIVILTLFRTILGVIIILEVIMLFKSGKTS